jgi:plasmid stabilization system protein ParE
MNYTFHPHVEKELEQIENYYDSISKELGDRFRDDIQITISRILKFPNGWPATSPNVRRCMLSSFPYGIIYRVRPLEVRVLAVMHERREPDYWTYRI